MRAVSFGLVLGWWVACSVGCGDDGGHAAVETAQPDTVEEALDEVAEVEATVEATAETSVEEAEADVVTRSERLRFLIAGAPVVDTKVRITRIDGTVEEPLTDSVGRVVIDDVVGPLSVVIEPPFEEDPGTGAVFAYAFVGYAEADFDLLRGADGEVVLEFAPPQPAGQLVQVDLLGLDASAHYVTIASNGPTGTPRGTYFAPDTTQLAELVSLPSEGPAHVIAYDATMPPMAPEIRGWTIASWDASTGPAALDFGTLTTPSSTTMSIPIPAFASTDTIVAAKIFADWDGRIGVGTNVAVTSGADAWSVDFQWVAPTGASGFRTEIAIYDLGSWTSTIVVDGLPPAALTTPLMAPPPFVVAPTSVSTLDVSPPEIEIAPTVRASVSLTAGAFGGYGSISYGQGVSRLDLPKRPGGAAFVAPGTPNLTYRIRLDDAGEHSRSASRSIGLAP